MHLAVKWQLLSQHLKDLSVVNLEFEDLILLASQLALELESERISTRDMNLLHLQEETSLTNQNEELV